MTTRKAPTPRAATPIDATAVLQRWATDSCQTCLNRVPRGNGCAHCLEGGGSPCPECVERPGKDCNSDADSGYGLDVCVRCNGSARVPRDDRRVA